ncbi:hypothetical protein I317_01702 [Kwoniella heveanensis CBS 569]|nr:hypothetical protein I317_01702 [Kwoniella heveanensis CBS 569]
MLLYSPHWDIAASASASPNLSASQSLNTTRKRPSGVVMTPTQTSTSTSRRSNPKSAITHHRDNGTDKGKGKNEELPENLTHTAQSDLAASELGVHGLPLLSGGDSGSGPGPGSIAARLGLIGPEFEGLSEDEIFKIVTMPKDIYTGGSNTEGGGNDVGDDNARGGGQQGRRVVPGWGIPPAVNPELASEALKTKVDHFLRLKYERGEHINTRLLSSSAFANPHIYSKLVEFVSIDERATAFPTSGWLTRRNLTSPLLLAKYSPRAMSEAQKRKAELAKLAQAAGARKEIGFTKGKYSDDKPKSRATESGWDKDKERDRGGHRKSDRERKRDRYEKDKERDRDRKRERR